MFWYYKENPACMNRFDSFKQVQLFNESKKKKTKKDRKGRKKRKKERNIQFKTLLNRCNIMEHFENKQVHFNKLLM